MQNPFDWDYLTTPPASDEVFNAFAILYLVVFLGGFVVSSYLYYRPWTKPFGRLFRRTSVVKATGISMWIFGTGLFFFLIRLLQINPLTFGEPIWMWLSILAVIAFFVWVGLSWSSERKARIAPSNAQRTHGRAGGPQSHPVKRPVRRNTNFR